MPPLPDPDLEGPILLPAHCATVTAEELRVRLVLAAERADATVIDASAVEHVGQAVLQLLIAAQAEASRDGRAIIIERPSVAFAERVTRCGLAAAIGLSSDGEGASA